MSEKNGKKNGNGNDAPAKAPKAPKEKKEKKPSIFSELIAALRKGPKTAEQLAEIIAKNSTKIDSPEQAKKTVSVRVYNLKKQGYEITGTAKEGKFTLVKEPPAKK